VIEAVGLTKRYGATVAVDDLSFVVPDGKVTGFLGPNGAGKSTTLRMMVGLDEPSAGHVRIDGRAYRSRRFPLRHVGALLEAKSTHPGRTARNHLSWLAASNGIPSPRVDEVLELVGLAGVAGRRLGGFSLGMGQRLGIASALLGDPRVLLLDEPVNGLDPEGILWVRHLLRGLAAEGRAVLISSHLMSEMALTADVLVVIGRGRLIAQGSVADVIQGSSGHRVRVVTPDAARLGQLLAAQGATVTTTDAETLAVTGMECRDVGLLAGAAGVTLFELTPETASLEEAFIEMTRGIGEFAADGVVSGS
jgi:ABC-2 type transport system ATP-binding protein